MTEIMLASDTGMSDGQIDDLANKVRDAARNHRDEFDKDAAQEALRNPDIGMQLLAVFRKLVEDIRRQVVHIAIVAVNRSRTPWQALYACGRKLYVNDAVVDAMPRGTGEKVRLVYFKPDPSAYKKDWLLCDALDAEYKKRGLVPDPQAQIDDNAANPEFADATPNACQWKDGDGNYCCAMLIRWSDERRVYIRRIDDVWGGRWTFAGVTQES